MANKPFGRSRVQQKSKHAKTASKRVTSALQSGDRVRFGEANGTVVKSDLFSDEDPIEFVRIDNSTGELVAIPRKLLEVFSEDFSYDC